ILRVGYLTKNAIRQPSPVSRTFSRNIQRAIWLITRSIGSAKVTTRQGSSIRRLLNLTLCAESIPREKRYRQHCSSKVLHLRSWGKRLTPVWYCKRWRKNILTLPRQRRRNSDSKRSNRNPIDLRLSTLNYSRF